METDTRKLAEYGSKASCTVAHCPMCEEATEGKYVHIDADGAVHGDSEQCGKWIYTPQSRLSVIEGLRAELARHRERLDALEAREGTDDGRPLALVALTMIEHIVAERWSNSTETNIGTLVLALRAYITGMEK